MNYRVTSGKLTVVGAQVLIESESKRPFIVCTLYDADGQECDIVKIGKGAINSFLSMCSLFTSGRVHADTSLYFVNSVLLTYEVGTSPIYALIAECYDGGSKFANDSAFPFVGI